MRSSTWPIVENVALNVLVAAAATAVEASIRHTTECLLVHAVDNRFGDPELAVVTCLVNSMAQPVEFSPYASAAEVVGAVDRGYVKAGRRRWLREEHYRRMYLAINRTTSVRTLTLNFLREPCAPELTPFLAGAPRDVGHRTGRGDDRGGGTRRAATGAHPQRLGQTRSAAATCHRPGRPSRGCPESDDDTVGFTDRNGRRRLARTCR